MTEPENPDFDTVPDFDDVSYAEIRAMLADAAATEPMPAEVAGDLDDLLANLVAQRAAEADPTVVPIRRARVARRLLVAAAAVVLVGAGGLGLNQVLQDTNANHDSAASGAGVQDLAEAPAPATGAQEKAPGRNELHGSLGTTGASPLDQAYANLEASAGFTRDGFDQQVKGLVSDSLSMGPSVDPTVPDADAPGSPAPSEGAVTTDTRAPDAWLKRAAAKKSASCPGPPATGGVIVVPITFEGRPATLAVHPVVDGSRYVAAWSCDGHRLLAFTTVPG